MKFLDEEFSAWCQQHQIPPETERYLQRIRSSPPAHRVRGRASNVSGRYPSIKMGVSIQWQPSILSTAISSSPMARTSIRIQTPPMAVSRRVLISMMVANYMQASRRSVLAAIRSLKAFLPMAGPVSMEISAIQRPCQW